MICNTGHVDILYFKSDLYFNNKLAETFWNSWSLDVKRAANQKLPVNNTKICFNLAHKAIAYRATITSHKATWDSSLQSIQMDATTNCTQFQTRFQKSLNSYMNRNIKLVCSPTLKFTLKFTISFKTTIYSETQWSALMIYITIINNTQF